MKNVQTSPAILSIIIGVVSIAYISFYNLNCGGLYVESPDGTLYLSVAQNFLNTGHFVQTARPYHIDMIVPFGLPLILTIFYGIFHHVYGIVFIQYILFGIANSYVFKIGYGISKNRIIGIVGWLLFISNSLLLSAANPKYVLTEAWTIPMMVMFMYYLLVEDNDVVCLVLGYIIWVIRPLYWPFFLLGIGICGRNIIARKCKVAKYLMIFCFMFGMFAINVYNNYHETKNMVWFENYAGIAFYQANNPSTKTMEYSSERAKMFVAEDDQFWDIYNSKMTESEKNNRYISMATTWINNNKGQFLINTCKKYYNMYVSKPIIFVSELIYLALCIYTKNISALFLGVCFFIITLQTAIGLEISRYSICTIPFYVLSVMVILTMLKIKFDLVRKKGEL